MIDHRSTLVYWVNLKRKWHSRLSEDKITERKKMQEYAKHIARRMLSTFWGVSAKINFFFSILKPCQEISQSLRESLQEAGKLVKNLEILWMNNKLINKFAFRIGWKFWRSRRIQYRGVWKWNSLPNDLKSSNASGNI